MPGDNCPPIWGQCNHAFHLHCIHKWLKSQPAGSQTCCLCRQPWRFKSDDGADGDKSQSEEGSSGIASLQATGELSADVLSTDGLSSVDGREEREEEEEEDEEEEDVWDEIDHVTMHRSILEQIMNDEGAVSADSDDGMSLEGASSELFFGS